jgi:aspartyl-tRNA(Asn)/glutamyl-tRNA(Gln) amidotransferase subunit A
VPVSWKDLFDTAGVATEAGTALLKGRVPAADAPVVQRLTAAGMPPLGKTHTTELAFSGLGLNPITATPPWRHDPDRVPGGSSSGAAASVAWGLAPIGIGTDTGGSVRVPAGWNDLVGPEDHGRAPAERRRGRARRQLRHDRPADPHVEDAALASRCSTARPPPICAAQRWSGRASWCWKPACSTTSTRRRQALRCALDRLGKAGATVRRGAIPAVAEAMGMAGILYAPECYAAWREHIEADPDAMFPPVLARFRAGAAPSAADFVAARARLDVLRLDYAQATAGYDAVLLPTTANLPPRIDAVLNDHACSRPRTCAPCAIPASAT